MKSIVFVAFFVVLFLSGCKKDESNPVVPVPAGPKAPTLSEPADSLIDVVTNPTFIWFVSDEAESYTLQVSTSKTFETLLFNETGITITQKQVTGLANLKEYYWRVRAVNQKGNSIWSATRVFGVTLGTVPEDPILVSPLNNKDSVILSPVFRWNKVKGAATYKLEISKTISFNQLVIDEVNIKDTTRVINNLDSSTYYYWRVKSINRYGSSSGIKSQFFKTLGGFICGTTALYYSGTVYNTVSIGTQCWLKENLNVGTMIIGTAGSSNDGAVQKYCYNNDTSNCRIYGGLYQWNEAMGYTTTAGTQGICPQGWHIPTIAEYQVCSTAVGGDGNALKAVGQGIVGGFGTNTSGFSALLSGYRSPVGVFYELNSYSTFWSSSEYNATLVRNMTLYYNGSSINLATNHDKVYGGCIRCIKD